MAGKDVKFKTIYELTLVGTSKYDKQYDIQNTKETFRELVLRKTLESLIISHNLRNATTAISLKIRKIK